jgi:nitrogen regulatory protein P-II 1
MKLIVAVIHPEDLGPVQSALNKLGVGEMSLSQVLVNSEKEAYTLIYRSTTIPVHFLPRIKLEIVVEDDNAEAAVAVISAAQLCGAKARIYVRSLDRDPLCAGA